MSLGNKAYCNIFGKGENANFITLRNGLLKILSEKVLYSVISKTYSIFWHTIFLLIGAPSLIVAPPSWKTFKSWEHNEHLLIKITIFQEFDDYPSDLINVPSLPFPKWQILDLSKVKEFADDDFKFEEIGRKFSKCLENTVGKGEIAHYEQFLLFPQCFQKTCTAYTFGQTFSFANWVQNKGSLGTK